MVMMMVGVMMTMGTMPKLVREIRYLKKHQSFLFCEEKAHHHPHKPAHRQAHGAREHVVEQRETVPAVVCDPGGRVYGKSRRV